MREIAVAIEYGNIRKHNEIAVQGRFHGADIPFKTAKKQPTPIELTKEQEAMGEQAINERFRAIQERKKRG